MISQVSDRVAGACGEVEWMSSQTEGSGNRPVAAAQFERMQGFIEQSTGDAKEEGRAAVGDYSTHTSCPSLHSPAFFFYTSSGTFLCVGMED